MSQHLNIQSIMSTADGVTYRGPCDYSQRPMRFAEINLQGNRHTGQCGGSCTNETVVRVPESLGAEEWFPFCRFLSPSPSCLNLASQTLAVLQQ